MRSSTFSFRKGVVKRCHERPLSQVAEEYDIPYSTIERWFYDLTPKYHKEQKKEATHICIDEFALRKGHNYAMAALDAQTGQVFHLEPGRDRKAVESLLSAVLLVI